MGERGVPVLWSRESGKFPRAALLLGGAALGVTLLLMGRVTPSEAESVEAGISASTDMEEYTRALEEKIRLFCEQVEGVDDVSVAVSLESGYRRVYARDDDAYVLVGSGSNRGTVYLTEESPRIGGIAVVCAGGGDAEVRRRLIGLLSAAFDIGTNKIYIAPAQN